MHAILASKTPTPIHFLSVWSVSMNNYMQITSMKNLEVKNRDSVIVERCLPTVKT